MKAATKMQLCFAEIAVRQKGIPEKVFLKNIYEGTQFYEIYRHTACNFPKNYAKKMTGD